MGLAPALFEEISYDESGNVQGGSFMDYLMPGSMETPNWETGKTVTPSPHHPFGAKGVGESATVGAAARDRECRGGCARAPWGAAPGDSDHAGEGVADPEGQGGGGVAGRPSPPRPSQFLNPIGVRFSGRRAPPRMAGRDLAFS